MAYTLGAKTKEYEFSKIEMAFYYEFGKIDTTKRTIAVNWYLTPKSTGTAKASYYLCNKNQVFKLRSSNKLYVDASWPATYKSGSKTVHNGYARAGGNTDRYYNGDTFFDTNGNFTGQRWWVHVLGSKYRSGTVTIPYPDSGKASFEVYGDFAWYDTTRRTFGWKTISLPSIEARYKVTYNANGGTNSGVNYQYKYEKKPLTLLNGKTFSRTGYSLDSWNTRADGTGIKYNTESSYTKNAAVTLYATWKPDEYKITFVGNAPSTASSTPVQNLPEQQIKYYGKTLILPAQKPVLPGYTFMGWSKSKDSNTVDYNPGDNFNENIATSLYAVWRANTYAVSFKEHPKFNQDKTLFTLTITFDSYFSDSDKEKFNNYNREGYELLGWSQQSVDIFKTTPTPSELNKIKFNPDRKYTTPSNIVLYPILKYSTTCYIKVKGIWKLAMPYVKVKGAWKQSLMYCKHNNIWKI